MPGIAASGDGGRVLGVDTSKGRISAPLVVLMGILPAGARPTFDTSPDDRFVADELLPAAIRVLPAVEAAGLASTWVGLYEMTPDHHPVVGPVAGLDGLLVATGFSGHGFQHGPVVGRLLAEVAVAGRAATIDIGPLRPERFALGELIPESHVV